ncbi:MAG: hypothetical protein KAI81_10080 [Candidatus Marinimicrobia bacterium]|nr:hypothetical protein [Candidatus Neomarinimicrobiota bacterium]
MQMEVLEKLEKKINASLDVIKILREEKSTVAVEEIGFPLEKKEELKRKLEETLHCLDELEVLTGSKG